MNRSSRTLAALGLLLGLSAPGAAAVPPPDQATLGPDLPGPLYDPNASGCAEVRMHSDSAYEMAVAWQQDGAAGPDFGAFAECYEGAFDICAVLLDLTQTGNQPGKQLDLFVWEDADGWPGAVVCAATGVDPGPVSFWPSVSRHRLDLAGACCTGVSWWVGYRGLWAGEDAGWYLAADLDPGPGCSMTRIAPGLGYPSGWQPTSVAWEAAPILGIGAEGRACGPTPIEISTWGRLKSLYR